MTGIGRNQHALRAASPRTPPPLLLALLRACSFRLENDAVASALPLGAWLGRSAISSGPNPLPSEPLRLPRQHPNRSGSCVLALCLKVLPWPDLLDLFGGITGFGLCGGPRRVLIA